MGNLRGRPSVKFQSTLSVRRATKGRPLEDLQKAISIHALRKESDVNRGDTHMSQRISIHALRKESDHSLDVLLPTIRKFQSTLSVRRATLLLD